MSSSPPTSLYILTTSQSPLPPRYPRPHKPILLLPPLFHRTLHSALDANPPSASSSSTAVIIPHIDSIVKHDVPAQIQNGSPLTDSDGADAEVTVKLHLIGSADASTRAGWISEALEFLERRKGLGCVDTLLVGFKGVDYKGKKTAASELFGCGVEGLENGSGTDVVDIETERGVREVWDIITKGDLGVRTLGTMYLPLDLLRGLSETNFPPKINAMDTPDCASLPKEYSGFAKEKGIELWASGGGEGADPLPVADLHNLLQEFALSLAESTELPYLTRDHPLAKRIPLRADGLKYEETAERGLDIRWVLGYTLNSKTRNVVQDRGFVVAADLFE